NRVIDLSIVGCGETGRVRRSRSRRRWSDPRRAGRTQGDGTSAAANRATVPGSYAGDGASITTSTPASKTGAGPGRAASAESQSEWRSGWLEQLVSGGNPSASSFVPAGTQSRFEATSRPNEKPPVMGAQPTKAASEDRVGQGADAIDGDGDDIAGLQIARWFEGRTHSCWGARGDDVSRFQRDHLRQGGDEGGNVENQVGDPAVLAELAVDLRPHLETGDVADRVGRHDPGTHRTVGVDGLADEPLDVSLLEAAGGDVVDDRVAEHVVPSRLGSDVPTAGADDHPELAFVVGRAGGVVRGLDRRSRTDERSRRFGD